MAGSTADPVIEGLLLEAAAENESRIVMTVDKIIARLLSDNLAYRMRLPCSMVGVHPCNRDGQLSKKVCMCLLSQT